MTRLFAETSGCPRVYRHRLAEVRSALRTRPGRISKGVGRTRRSRPVRPAQGPRPGRRHRGTDRPPRRRLVRNSAAVRRRPTRSVPARPRRGRGRAAVRGNHQAPYHLPGVTAIQTHTDPTGDDVSTPTATRLHAPDASVTVLSNTPFVTDWSQRYFGPWWNTFEAPTQSLRTGPLAHRRRRRAAYTDLATQVAACPHEEVTYAKARLLLTRDSTAVFNLDATCQGWHGSCRGRRPPEQLVTVHTANWTSCE